MEDSISGEGKVKVRYDKQDIAYFRRLTKRVIAAEKQGFWSDWTPHQQKMYQTGDWKKFSRSRGYTEAEIDECQSWMDMALEAKNYGVDLLSTVKDLIDAAAAKNVSLDKNCEIEKSSDGMGLQQMEALEGKMAEHPDVMTAEDMPVKHSYTDTQYIRESFVPAGVMFTTPIHKTEHPMFIIKGDVTIMTDGKKVRIKAPYYGITKAGTKRVIYTHEDSICVTVHTTKERDPKKLREELVAETMEEFNKLTHKGEQICHS